MSDEPRLEEQALSEAAEMTLSKQLDEVESIDVDLRTNLLKLLKGEADSLSIAGQGLVVHKDIRVHEIEVYADTIALNVLSAIFGEIELDRPVGATVRLVLTEKDINRALKSDYIRSKLQPLELNADGQIITLELQQLEIQLPGGGRIGLKGTVLLQEDANTRPVGFTAVICPRTYWQTLLLEEFKCTQGEGISLELALTLMKRVKELINLPYFDLDGIALRLKKLEVQEGSLTLHTEGYIKQLPAVKELLDHPE